MALNIFAHKIRHVQGNVTGTIEGATMTGATLTSPTITAPAISGAATIATGATITTPIITRNVEALTATEVLVAADSGKLLTLGTAGGFDTKLPAPAVGLWFTFVVKVAPTTAYTITTNGTTQNVIHGLTVTKQDAGGNTDGTAGTAVDVITFAANKAAIGDRVELICDGTLWYAVAYANVFDGITFD